MSDYTIIAERSRKLIAQKFYLSLVAENGQVLMISEMLRDKKATVERGQRIATRFKIGFINAT